jgi:hypothetical protein
MITMAIQPKPLPRMDFSTTPQQVIIFAICIHALILVIIVTETDRYGNTTVVSAHVFFG